MNRGNTALPRELLAHLPAELGLDATVEDLVEVRRKHLRCERPWSLPDFESVARKQIAPLLALIRCVDLTPAIVLAWERFLASPKARSIGVPYSERTIKKAENFLAGILEEAVVAGLIEKNPVCIPRVLRPLARTAPDDIEQGKRVMPWPELARVLATAKLDPFDMIVVVLCAYAGLRAGEALALFWDQVVPGAGLDELLVAYSYNRKAGLVRPTTKSGVPRHVPIHPVLRALLELVRGYFTQIFGREPGPYDLVAPAIAADGSPTFKRDTTVVARFKRACVVAGVKPRTLKDLRHGMITHLRKACGDRQLVRRLTHPPAMASAFDRYDHYDWAERVAGVNKLPLGELAERTGA